MHLRYIKVYAHNYNYQLELPCISRKYHNNLLGIRYGRNEIANTRPIKYIVAMVEAVAKDLPKDINKAIKVIVISIRRSVISMESQAVS